MYYFCSKCGSYELDHAATGDLKNGGKGVKRGLDPYHLFRSRPRISWDSCPNNAKSRVRQSQVCFYTTHLDVLKNISKEHLSRLFAFTAGLVKIITIIHKLDNYMLIRDKSKLC